MGFYGSRIPPFAERIPLASAIVYKEGDYAVAKVWNEQWGRWSRVAKSTDHASVIQAAIDSLTPNRTWKEKVILKGDFVVSKTIKIPSYTVLELNGSIKLADGANARIITNKNTDTGDQYIDIIGGVIDGNKANQTSEFAGIRLYGCSYCVIRNVTVRNVYGIGIWISPNLDGSVRGKQVAIVSSVFINNRHHHMQISSDECIVMGNLLDTTDMYDGIQVDTANRNLVANNVILNSAREGIRIMTYEDGYGNENVIANNIIVGAFNGINVTGGATGKEMYRNVVIGNYIYNVSQDGIVIDYSPNSVVEGNYVEGNGRYGINVWRNSHYTEVVNNYIIDHAGTSGRGINADSDYLLIEGNYIVNSAVAGIDVYGSYCHVIANVVRDSNYNIRFNESQHNVAMNNLCVGGNVGIEETANGDYNYIIGNRVLNNSVAGIRTNGANTVVKRNIGYLTENSGTAVILAGSTKVTVNHGLVSTPEKVHATPLNDPGTYWYIANRNSTTFDIVLASPPSSDVIFSWYAEV